MNWLKRDAHYIDSDCGKYRINKAIVGGEAVYQAVRLPSEIIAVGTLAECKRACGA